MLKEKAPAILIAGKLYITVKCAAETLGVSRRALYKWGEKGTGPKRSKLGSRLFYSPKDLREHLVSNDFDDELIAAFDMRMDEIKTGISP